MMYSKKYFELFAQLCLQAMFETRYANLICADKPDLQDNARSIGVEVTTAFASHELDGLYDKYCGKPVSVIKPCTVAKLRSEGGSFNVFDGKVYSLNKPNYTPEQTCKSIIAAIERKNSKLADGGYKEFAVYELFVFVDCKVVGLEEVNKCILWMKEHTADSQPNYSRLYILNGERLFVSEKQLSAATICPVSDKQYNLWNYQAVRDSGMYSQEEFSLLYGELEGWL